MRTEKVRASSQDRQAGIIDSSKFEEKRTKSSAESILGSNRRDPARRAANCEERQLWKGLPSKSSLIRLSTERFGE
jgi:hypothetical protein